MQAALTLSRCLRRKARQICQSRFAFKHYFIALEHVSTAEALLPPPSGLSEFSGSQALGIRTILWKTSCLDDALDLGRAHPLLSQCLL